MTPEEAIAIARARHRAANVSVPDDVERSAIGGFLRGMASLPDILYSQAQGVKGEFENIDALPMQSEVGLPPEYNAAPVRETLARNVPLTEYRAKTEPGKYGETIGEAASGLVLGPGGLARKGMMAIGAGVTSELGGQMAQEHAPAWEPVARVTGMVAGGGVMAGRPSTSTIMSAAKEVARRAPDPERLRNTITQMYDLFRRSQITYDTNTYAGLGQRIHHALLHARHRPVTSPEAFDRVDELVQDALTGRSPDFDDMERLAQRLGADARGLRSGANPRNTAADALEIVRDLVDDFAVNAPLISNIPASARMIEHYRGTVRGLALQNIKSRRMTNLMEASGDHNGGFLVGLQTEINKALRTPADRQLFNRRERELLRAVRDGNRPVNAIGYFGVDMRNPKLGQLAGPAMVTGAALPATLALQMGSPAAIPALVGAGTAVAGTVARVTRPGRARKALATATTAMRSPEFGPVYQAHMLEANRRRMRQLMTGVPAMREALDEERPLGP